MKTCGKTFKKVIKLPIYNAIIHLHVVDRMETMQMKLEKKNKHIMLDVTGCDGCVFQLSEKDIFEYYIVLQEDKLSYNLITHEVYHLATNIAGDIGIQEHESIAWLIGHLAEEIYRILMTNQFTIQQ